MRHAPQEFGHSVQPKTSYGFWKRWWGEDQASDLATFTADTPFLYDAAAGDRVRQGNGNRGVEFMFVGSDAANEAFVFDIYLIESVGIGRPRALHAYGQDKMVLIPRLFFSGTATLGTKAGVEDGYIDDAILIADEIAEGSTADLRTSIVEAYGRALVVHSPSSNGIATLFVPDFGSRFGIGINLPSLTADTVATANILYRYVT
jgi:hypothetical protein